MRVRAVVAIVLLLLPVELSAQRIPLPRIFGGRGPGRPAALPPQAPEIAQALAYRRLPVSVETYPLISYVEYAGFAGAGVGSSWTSFGTGTRVDYRVTRHFSATLDVTSSFLGGPARTGTLELGTRVRPERTERKVYPFVDFRAGYVYAYNTNFGAIDDTFGFPPNQHPGFSARYSSGFGGVGGAGMEYALTRTLSLTTAASVIGSRMTSTDFDRTTTDGRYLMTSYRYTLGIRYNPVRLIRPTSQSDGSR